MAELRRPPVKDFGTAPAGYVAGVGRGAVGFTTRSDIGPARAVATREDRYAPQRPPANPFTGAPVPAAASAEQDLSEFNYDQFSGYGGSLFADSSAPYDAEDAEADAVYDQIDRKIAQRSEAKQKKREMAAAAAAGGSVEAKRPKLQEQFADVKRQLASLSDSEWMAIPEPGDLSKRNKRVNKLAEKFTPVPDSVVASAVASTKTVNVLDTALDGVATPYGGGISTSSDLTRFGAARNRVLSINLDKMSDSVSGQTVVDPKGYLTDLNSVKINSDAELSDLRKARVLVKSMIASNPESAPGWLLAARIEEAAGSLSAARKLIMKGTAVCSASEDVWLEAARLHPPAAARSIVAQAVRALPTSVKLWLKASSLEDKDVAKRAVLRRALECVPGSLVLWKAAVQLEEPDEARVLLARAVECVPGATELWLALARLETYDQARKVLNKARKAVPTEPLVWITAAQLEEAHGATSAALDAIISRAVRSLAQHNLVIDRSQWLGEAEAAEAAGSPLTCAAIVRATLGIGVEAVDRRVTWQADARAKLAAGSVETARAIHAQLLAAYPNKQALWYEAAQMEKQHGDHASVMALLRRAVDAVPGAEVLWLMSAKELWLAGDVDTARSTLERAFSANPDAEQIWLAAVKLESECGEQQRAAALLQRARERVGSERVFRVSAVHARATGDTQAERELLEEALQRFPAAWKLHAMLAQNREAAGADEEARALYRRALTKCPEAVALWLGAARLDARAASLSKARATLEAARKRLPHEELLWQEAVRVEQKAGSHADKMMARALQACPSSGLLWADAIEMEARPKRKAKSYDALKRCASDANVFVAVARLFWADRKLHKAKDWFERAVDADKDLGDSWAHYYRFARQHLGGEDAAAAVLKRVEEASPRHGQAWTAVSKAVGNERLTPSQVCVKVAEGLPDGLV